MDRIGQIAVFITVLLVLDANGLTQSNDAGLERRIKQLVTQIERAHDVDVHYRKSPRLTWPVQHELAQQDDHTELYQYLVILQQEFAKHPKEFLQRTDLRHIFIAKNVAINGQARTAVPDFVNEVLVLDFDVFDQDDNYIRHVIHHELYHLFEEEVYGDVYYKDPKWLAITASHHYGSGGANMRDGHVTELDHPKPGFINHYATSGVEEDKAEVFAALRVPAERAKVMRWIDQGDQLLARKVNYIQQTTYAL